MAKRSLAGAAIVAVASLVGACSSQQPAGAPCDSSEVTKLLTLGTGGGPASACVAESLQVDTQGLPSCVVVAGSVTHGSCTCDTANGLAPVSPVHQGVVDLFKEDPGAAPADCFCEVLALTGTAKEACQNDVSGTPLDNGASVDGWCYLDGTTVPPIGNAELVAPCASSARHQIRLVGAAQRAGDQVLMVCETTRCF